MLQALPSQVPPVGDGSPAPLPEVPEMVNQILFFQGNLRAIEKRKKMATLKDAGWSKIVLTYLDDEGAMRTQISIVPANEISKILKAITDLKVD